jgi:hypothetical protein
LGIVIRQVGTRRGRRTYEIRLHVEGGEALVEAPPKPGKGRR